MTSIYTPQDGKQLDAAIHSDILEKSKFKGTPAYQLAISRYIRLGLTEEEAQAVLKG